jgi:Ni/Co efflux regulator RcnB
MKKLLAVVMSLSLLIPAISEAQNNSRQNTGRGRPAASAPNRSGRPSRPQGRTGRESRPERPSRGQAGRPSHRGTRPAATRPSRPRPPAARRPTQARYRPLPPRGNQFWHRGRWNNRIRGPAFVWPRGYSYRRWGIGAILPSVFLAPTFFYTGWGALGLQAPVPGYTWVRYGPDLLLVNLTTREIEDVIYGVFL